MANVSKPSQILPREQSEGMEKYTPENNRTSPILTRYERAKLLGLRTEQIARGAKPLVDLMDPAFEGLSPADIAMEELRQKKTPFIIVRNLPDGKREHWKVKDMIVIAYM